MAWPVKDKSGNFLVGFRWAGKPFTRSLDTHDPAVAQAAVARVEETIMRLRRGWLTMPPDAEPGLFIISGGQLTTKPAVEPPVVHSTPPTICTLFARYHDSLTPGAKEANTLLTESIHRGHLCDFLGDRPVDELRFTDLQEYVHARAMSGRDTVTIRKELATLRMIWNRMNKRGHAPPFAWKLNDLSWPKSGQKEPFKTWAEIERRIATGGLSPQRVKAMWECLYLDEAQIGECLAWVREHSRHAFVYPMFAFAAYTGARRSEILRCEVEDFKFSHNTLDIREKKSDAAHEYTIRSIPLHPALAEVMRAWFEVHPGGHYPITASGGNTSWLANIARSA
jgi:Phage integrase family